MVQEIGKFLKADTGFMNSRPLRYSLVLDLHPDYIPHVADAKRKLKLREAILCSYHPNEVDTSFHLIIIIFLVLITCTSFICLKDSCKILFKM